MMIWSLHDIVDFDAYPLDAPDSESYGRIVAAARASLRADGCVVLQDFIRESALQELSSEVHARKHLAHYSTEAINPYFHTEFNCEYPERHPVNTFTERTSGFVPGDAWEDATMHRILFEESRFGRLLADCLELDSLYPYADPLAGLTENVLNPGQQFAWHFDTNEFAVTVLVDEAEDGGLFEYVPNIRSIADEGFVAIQAVLDGDREGVRTLQLSRGDLQIFRGRHSLHRVTRVADSSGPRHTAIFAYTEKPGVIGRVVRTRQLFGRVLPEHEAAEAVRVRSDALLD